MSSVLQHHSLTVRVKVELSLLLQWLILGSMTSVVQLSGRVNSHELLDRRKLQTILWRFNGPHWRLRELTVKRFCGLVSPKVVTLHSSTLRSFSNWIHSLILFSFLLFHVPVIVLEVPEKVVRAWQSLMKEYHKL